jgi:ABC-type dipeptide/oligopeptide/nickel transport system permease subunit
VTSLPDVPDDRGVDDESMPGGPPFGDPVVADGPAHEVPARPLTRTLRRLRRNRSAVMAASFVGVLVVVALAAPLLAPEDPLAQDLRNVLESPSGEHLLGTDDVGRDVVSRMIFATRVSLLAALEAVAIGVVLGVPFGLMAGFRGGAVDTVIMRTTDAILSFPPLILAISIVGVLGPGLTNAMVAVGVVFAPRFARVVRASVLSTREETFIEASRSIGTSRRRIMQWHVLPNVVSPLIVQVSLAGGFAMLAEAGLSFLGLGVQAPDASWGSMLGRAFPYINSASWLSIVPGIAIAVTVLAFNIIGDGLRDAIGQGDQTR